MLIRSRFRTLLVAATILQGAGLASARAQDAGLVASLPASRALPGEATVVHGAVSIDRAAEGALKVVQASDRAIVNWQSFDIAEGNRVDVLQNGAGAAALFRVTGSTDSRIAGSLVANGQLFLVNPNGIAIAKGAQVSAGSFVASTLDIADADFLAGRLHFRRTGAVRGVANAGTITAGNVALIGGSVVNEGVVSARLGKVGYGAGDAVTLDFGGDNFLSVAIPLSEAGELTDAFGRPLSALVTAGGSTLAQGGRIYISAAAARSLMLGAVRVEGSLVATSFREGADGKVSLGSVTVDGGDGLVQASGTIDATGGTGLAGGRVAISGGTVGLGGTIDASGDAAGGSVDVRAGSMLSLAAAVGARGMRGDGGSVSYVSGGAISENTSGVTDVSGAIDGGRISVSAAGDLATSGSYAAEGLLGLGGRIDLTGASVRLLSTRLSARGLQQGGLVRVGGAFQGGAADRTARADYERFEGRFGPLPDLASAQKTFVNDGVAIDVSSARGTGGGVIVWSDRQTTMLGSVNAAGLRTGGSAEISGKDELRYVDLANISTGLGGSLLLDPQNIVIGDATQASSWQYAAIIGLGVAQSVPGVNDLEASDNLGTAVALNAAGDRMAVGAAGDDGLGNTTSSAGSVRLFTFSGGDFNGARLAGTIGRGYTGAGNIDLGTALGLGEQFGWSVALNAAGDRLAVGAIGDGGLTNNFSNSGAVRLFTFTDTSFGGGALAATIGRGYTGAKDFDPGAALSSGEQFGSGVALNAAGDRLAVGARYDSGSNSGFTNSGSVRLFTFSDTSFGGVALAATIGRGYTGGSNVDLGTGLETGDQFGWSVALNAAGDRLAVGGLDPGTTNAVKQAGSVRLFTFGNTSFGAGALVGTIGVGYTGTGNLDIGSGLADYDYFGSSVALNAAGDRLAVGAMGDDGSTNAFGDSGAVRLFSFGDTSFGTPTLTSTIGRGYTGGSNLDPGAVLLNGGWFGSSVAFNAAGDRLAVGTPYDSGANGGASNSGAVRMFTFADRSLTAPRLVGTLGFGYHQGTSFDVGSGLNSTDLLGQSVALNGTGNRLAVGALDDGFGNLWLDSGSVRLFTFANDAFGGGALVGTIGRGFTGAGNFDASFLDAGDQFGLAISLNAAGDRLAVGAAGDDGADNTLSNVGAVHLFTFSNSDFGGTARAATIGRGYTGTANINVADLEISDAFGGAVSLNAAGDRLAVGAVGDDGVSNLNTGAGAVRLFAFSDTSFGGGALAATLGSGYTGGKNQSIVLDSTDQFGSSVSLNAAGNRLAVGALGDDGSGNGFSDSGSVRLFTFSDSNFSGGAVVGTLGRGFSGAGNLDLSTALGNFENFGSAVSLNAAGDRLAAGARNDGGFSGEALNAGSVRLFTFANTSFGTPTLAGTIGRGYTGAGNFDLGTSLEAGDGFGSSVSLNAQGTRLAVGAPTDDGAGNALINAGLVRLFTFSTISFGGTSLAGTIGLGNGSLFNSRLDLGTDLEVGDGVGTAIALNASGTRLALGAPSDDGAGNVASNSGSVRLFTFANSNFGGGALVGTIGRGYTGTGNLDLGTALENNDRFGASVALNAAGDRMAVGATGDAGFGNGASAAGSVRLFTFSNTSFASPTLAGHVGSGYTGGLNVSVPLDANDQFGASVALNAAGDRLAVGVPGDDGVGNATSDVGAVRLFTFTNSSFGGGARSGVIGQGYTALRDLNLSGALGNADRFGTSVALNAAGDTLVAGAPYHDGVTGGVSDSGLVMLFSFGDPSLGAPSLLGRIGVGYLGSQSVNVASQVGTGDLLGMSVALNAAGDLLAVGAPGDDGFGDSAANTGAVRFFRFADSAFARGRLVSTIGQNYTGSLDLDTRAALPYATAAHTIGSGLAMNADGSSIALGLANQQVFLLRAPTALSLGSLGFANNAAGTSNISAAALQAALSTGQSITFEASNDITLASNLTVANASGRGGALTLRAGRSILLNGSIVTDDADLSLFANSGGSDLATVNANRLAGAAQITMAAGTSINAGTGLVTIDLGNGAGLTTPTSGDVTLGNITASRIAVINAGPTAGSDVILQPGAVLTATGLGRGIEIQARNGTFTNNAGSGGLQLTGGGTYAIWSDAPDTTLEGVAGYLKRYNVADAEAFQSLSSDASYVAYRLAPVLTVTAGNASRQYGDANPAFDYTVSGFIDGDSAATALSGAAGLATLADQASGVGSYAITASAGTLLSDLGYQFAFQDGTLSVTARPLEVTATSFARYYGSANPALTWTVGGAGLVGGDTLSGALATTALQASDVGAYAITQGTLAAGANYALTFTEGTMDVLARPIRIQARNITRFYGDANPVLAYSVGGAGLANGDVLTGALSTTAGQASDVGTYAITQGTLAASSNYVLTYVDANLTVAARPITIRARALSRAYGDANPALAYTIGGRGLANGDVLTGALATTAGTQSNVGTYAITQGDLAATSNYALTYQGADLTVTPRRITVAAQALSRAYGDDNPALAYTIGGAGLINGDTLTGELATVATTLSDVGTYAITQGTLSATANYLLTYTPSSLRIVPRRITVAAQAKSRAYGDANPALTYTIGGAGLVNGDTISGGLRTSATVTSGVGSYAIENDGLTVSSNYLLTYTPSTLRIVPRQIIVTADPQSRIYGEANPNLTYTVGGRGLVNGDSLTGELATTASALSGVGAYAITRGTLAASPNYALTFRNGVLSVTPRPITVTADDLFKQQGTVNPVLTYTVGGMGLVNGDVLTGALATTATTVSPVGTYAITRGTLAATRNYTLQYLPGELDIVPAPAP